jgi:demethylmenaquinone methyltransferase / 2-methoxy-6-polyprenyl-1,4-benzoquinol methylase
MIHAMSDTEHFTHFGYQSVAAEEKAGKVADVFDSVASSYDLMNDLMSFGVHRLWKRFAIGLCQFQSGQRVLDLAGGTGDLTAKISPIVGDQGQVILADINHEMLKVGRNRLLDRGIYRNVDIVQTDAEALSFPEHYFDRIVMGFGLRNVTRQDKALASMYRCLKPGGLLVVLEFSKPTTKIMSTLYDAYSFHLLPKIGKLVAKDEASYQYLAESIRMHPGQEQLKEMMSVAGFDRCDYHNLTGGIVALHRGWKY